MGEDTERQTQPAGREISLLAFGDTAAELEMTALDEARAFFGADLRLHIVPAYRVLDVLPGLSLEQQAGGKKYYARVIVRIIEPS